MVYWIDHPFSDQTRGKPLNIVGAELAPNELFEAINEITPGKFYIEILKLKPNYIRVRKYFTIKPEIHKLIICFKIERGKEVIDVLKGWLMTD
jgi:hypothetical protein